MKVMWSKWDLSLCTLDLQTGALPIALWRAAYLFWKCIIWNEPAKWQVHPEKTQISLRISSVWSESLISVWRKLGSSATHWVHSKDSDQTGWMPGLIWVFTGHTCYFVGFVMPWLKYYYYEIEAIQSINFYLKSNYHIYPTVLSTSLGKKFFLLGILF